MNRYYRSGMFALVVLGGFYAWRNRFAIQRFLESNGIRTPLDTSTIGDSIKSGIAKVTGRVQKESRELGEATDAQAV